MLIASKACSFLVRRLSSLFNIMLRKSLIRRLPSFFYFMLRKISSYHLSSPYKSHQIFTEIIASTITKNELASRHFWAISLTVHTVKKMLIASKACSFLVRRLSSLFNIMLRKSYCIFLFLLHYKFPRIF